jgi:hypothetical protein
VLSNPFHLGSPARIVRAPADGIAVKQIRIALVGMSQIMVEMIEAILAAEPDLVVAAKVANRFEVTAALHRRRIDVIIECPATEAPGSTGQDLTIPELLNDRPRKLLTIHQDGQDGSLWVLRPHHTAITGISAGSLVAAIRARP